jgi:hypothetical protein
MYMIFLMSSHVLLSCFLNPYWLDCKVNQLRAYERKLATRNHKRDVSGKKSSPPATPSPSKSNILPKEMKQRTDAGGVADSEDVKSVGEQASP